MYTIRGLALAVALLAAGPHAAVAPDVLHVEGAETAAGLEISATYEVTSAIHAAMIELERAGPYWLDYVARRVAMVESVPLPVGEAQYVPALPRGLVNVPEHYRATWVAPRPHHATPVWLASLLVHEATHHQQFLDGQLLWDCASEREAQDAQIGFLRAHNTSESHWLANLAEEAIRRLCP